MAEEAVSLAEDLGANGALPNAWGNLAVWCAVLGDPDPARTYARKSMSANRRYGKAQWWEEFNLLTLSWCAASDGDFELAAKLDGAHEALKLLTPSSAGFTYSPPEVELEATNHARIIEALGADVAERYISIGRALPFNQVIDMALRTARTRALARDFAFGQGRGATRDRRRVLPASDLVTLAQIIRCPRLTGREHMCYHMLHGTTRGADAIG